VQIVKLAERLRPRQRRGVRRYASRSLRSRRLLAKSSPTTTQALGIERFRRLSGIHASVCCGGHGRGLAWLHSRGSVFGGAVGPIRKPL